MQCNKRKTTIGYCTVLFKINITRLLSTEFYIGVLHVTFLNELFKPFGNNKNRFWRKATLQILRFRSLIKSSKKSLSNVQKYEEKKYLIIFSESELAVLEKKNVDATKCQIL